MYQRIDQLEAKFPDDLKAQQELLKIGIVGRISVNKEQDGAHGLEMLHLIKLDRSSIKPTPPPQHLQLPGGDVGNQLIRTLIEAT